MFNIRRSTKLNISNNDQADNHINLSKESTAAIQVVKLVIKTKWL